MVQIPSIDDLRGSQLEHFLKARPTSADSKQKKFLDDFIDCVPDTAGGRLAHWIADLNYAVPAFCTKEAMQSSNEVTFGETMRFNIFTCDASKAPIDAPVSSLSARVVSRLGDSLSPYEGSTKKESALCINARTGEQYCCSTDTVFGDLSFEEQRHHLLTHRTGPPLVTRVSDGQFRVAWSPARPGTFLFHIEVDQQDISGSPFEVVVNPNPLLDAGQERVGSLQLDDDVDDKIMQLPPSAYISLISDLTVYGGPSRDTIEMGRIPINSIVKTSGELESTEDGVWVKLSQESIDQFVEPDFRFLDAWVPVLSLPAFGGIEFLRIKDEAHVQQAADVVKPPTGLI
jgi:hypothetical protein